MPSEHGRQYVWDVPVRVFHWLLVALICFSWWTVESDRMDWHRYSGLSICGLIIFRLLWGVIGTDTARFTQFVKGPKAIWNYVRQGLKQLPRPGHTPLGALSVLALLIIISIQITTGLFAVDVDGLESGPLSHLVDFDSGRSLAEIHETNFNILLAFAGLHIAAILFYLIVKRQNLTGAMITGYKSRLGKTDLGAERVSFWRLIIAIALAALAVYAIEDGFRF